MIMDDNSSSCPGPPISGSPSMTPANKTGNDDPSHHKIRYSMPGILHFLQTEWTRFEMERSQWEVERAELQARIAFLQGERKGQENLKQDLVRRIKMLEFALKQERAKYNRAMMGMESSNSENKSSEKNEEEEQMDTECLVSSTTTDASNVTWRQGRQLLRQYLQEIGYTDTILDVRSARVRALLGLQPYNGECDENRLVNGDEGGAETATQKRNGKKAGQSLGGGALIESEASVLATFDFLGTGHVIDDEDEENLSDGENEDGMAADDESEERLERQQNQVIANDESVNVEDMEDEDTDEALAEFDFLVSETLEGDRDISGSVEWGVDHELISKLKEQYRKERKGKRGVQRPKRSTLQAMLANLGNDDDLVTLNMNRSSNMNSNQIMSRRENDEEEVKPGIIGHNEDDVLEVALGLGDLAGLTVNNDADPLNYDIAAPKETFRKTWNAKYTLRSHFDGVRALAFHPVEPVLITAAEDHTLKLWNLQKTVPAKKTASLDVEPVYTFRGHIGPVLCLAMSATGEQCFSGGMDSTIRCWNIPSSNIDPYDSYDCSVIAETYESHTNAVWGLAIHSSRTHLLSCSGDGTVKLWSPGTKTPLLNTFTVADEPGVPSSVDFVRCEPNQMVAAYTSSNTYILDMESSKEILKLETKHNADSNVSNQINRVVSHPTLPVTITAHEDRFIRFFDNNTGKMIHSMVAHLDAVTSLAVDPNGLYLLSGSHDCSIRLWNLESKTCVQEITSHRKKFDESIYDVCFHASKPYIASAGADALAKVFV